MEIRLKQEQERLKQEQERLKQEQKRKLRERREREQERDFNREQEIRRQEQERLERKRLERQEQEREQERELLEIKRKEKRRERDIQRQAREDAFDSKLKKAGLTIDDTEYDEPFPDEPFPYFPYFDYEKDKLEKEVRITGKEYNEKEQKWELVLTLYGEKENVEVVEDIDVVIAGKKKGSGMTPSAPPADENDYEEERLEQERQEQEREQERGLLEQERQERDIQRQAREEAFDSKLKKAGLTIDDTEYDDQRDQNYEWANEDEDEYVSSNGGEDHDRENLFGWDDNDDSDPKFVGDKKREDELRRGAANAFDLTGEDHGAWDVGDDNDDSDPKFVGDKKREDELRRGAANAFDLTGEDHDAWDGEDEDGYNTPLRELVLPTTIGWKSVRIKYVGKVTRFYNRTGVAQWKKDKRSKRKYQIPGGKKFRIFFSVKWDVPPVGCTDPTSDECKFTDDECNDLLKNLSKGKEIYVQEAGNSGRPTIKSRLIPIDELNFQKEMYNKDTSTLVVAEASASKPGLSPVSIPSGELSAMLAELSSMDNTESEYASQSEYASESEVEEPLETGWKSDDFASSDFASESGDNSSELSN